MSTIKKRMDSIISVLRPIAPEPIVDIIRKGTVYKKFEPYVQTKVVDNIQFKFLIGDPTGEDWYRDYQCLSPEMSFTKSMINPNDVIIEVGAHHGFTTILLSKWVSKKGSVIAFECSPHNTSILLKNIELNDIHNVDVISKAVSSEDGYARISGGSNTSIVHKTWNTSCKVKMTKLDNYYYLKPTFLKIDAEGYEIEILKGASKIMETKPKLAIEVHITELKSLGRSPKDLLDLIDSKSYKIYLQPNGKTAPYLYDNRSIEMNKQVHLYAIPK
jgi:FkbM family methyltransferase